VHRRGTENAPLKAILNVDASGVTHAATKAKDTT